MSDSESTQAPTTAETLSGYYKELLAEGVPSDLAGQLLINAGLVLHSEEPLRYREVSA